MIPQRRFLPLFIAAACLAAEPFTSSSTFAGKGKPGGGEPPPVTFQLRWLPVGTEINDINNDCDLAVTFDNGTTKTGQIWIGGTPYNVNDLIDDPDWDFISAYDLSNRSNDGTCYVIAGGYYQGTITRARLKLAISSAGEAPVVLDLLPFPSGHLPRDVNVHGEVVGYYSEVSGGPRSAFFYSDASGLNIFDSTLFNVPVISDSGYVAYNYEDPQTGDEGFARWDSRTGEIRRWYSYRWGIVAKINDAGNFSGSRDVLLNRKSGNYQRMGFIFDGTSFRDFSEINNSNSLSVNNNNDAVGISGFTGVRLYLSSTNTLYDVSTLLAPDNAAEDVALWDSAIQRNQVNINDSGVIVGNRDYGEQGFVLLPIAAP